MHVQVRTFITEALRQYGPITGAVVEFGSRNANGEIRDLFPDASSYLGIDITPGPGVDLVGDAATWQPKQAYNCVISTETFEHTARWPDILQRGAMALAPDGIMLVTCATTLRKPHSATIADKSPQPGEYYGNVSYDAFRREAERLDLEATITIDDDHHDLYAMCRRKLPPNGLQIIGAGMWRTGTVSLKSALETLTGKPCHHMSELQSPLQTQQWLDVVNGRPADWQTLVQNYACTLDWPSLAYWEELAQAYPRAMVLLSTRDPEQWWQSISKTVLLSAPTADNASTPWEQLVVKLFNQHFVGRHPTKQQAITAYNRHNDHVRQIVPFHRLIEWQPSDGWTPLARALHVPIPDKPFPHKNTTAEYRRNNRLNASSI